MDLGLAIGSPTLSSTPERKPMKDICMLNLSIFEIDIHNNDDDDVEKSDEDEDDQDNNKDSSYEILHPGPAFCYSSRSSKLIAKEEYRLTKIFRGESPIRILEPGTPRVPKTPMHYIRGDESYLPFNHSNLLNETKFSVANTTLNMTYNSLNDSRISRFSGNDDDDDINVNATRASSRSIFMGIAALDENDDENFETELVDNIQNQQDRETAIAELEMEEEEPMDVEYSEIQRQIEKTRDEYLKDKSDLKNKGWRGLVPLGSVDREG